MWKWRVPPYCCPHIWLFTPNYLDSFYWMVSYIECYRILSASVLEMPIPGGRCSCHEAGTLSLWGHSAAFKQRARPSLQNDDFPRLA